MASNIFFDAIPPSLISRDARPARMPVRTTHQVAPEPTRPVVQPFDVTREAREIGDLRPVRCDIGNHLGCSQLVQEVDDRVLLRLGQSLHEVFYVSTQQFTADVCLTVKNSLRIPTKSTSAIGATMGTRVCMCQASNGGTRYVRVLAKCEMPEYEGGCRGMRDYLRALAHRAGSE
eukprot:1178522-Prorocentrum_minimum.AAC.4